MVKGIITKEPKHLIIKSSGEKKKINYNEIYYIESMGHYVTIHLENEKLIWKNNLKDVYIILGKNGFISVHRSYLVNLRHIEEISKEYCILSNKEEIPISRNSYKTVNTAFIDYYKVGGF